MFFEERLEAIEAQLKMLHDLNNEVKSVRYIVENKQYENAAKKRLTEEEVCNQLGVCKRTLSNYRDQKKLPYIQVGKKIYYRQGDIDRFLDNHRIE